MTSNKNDVRDAKIVFNNGYMETIFTVSPMQSTGAVDFRNIHHN